MMHFGVDPLTRLAPADESAGCEPPSPPRGRGLQIQNHTPDFPQGGRRPASNLEKGSADLFFRSTARTSGQGKAADLKNRSVLHLLANCFWEVV